MKPDNRYEYGSVLLLEREQPEAYWRDCCEKMRRLHMNTVVVWPPVFYVDGKRDYTCQRRFLDVAAEHGLDVIVELTGQVANLEYFPDHLYNDEYAVLNADGTVARMQNGLGEMNLNHPRVKQALREFFTGTVSALKDHPALVSWDMWNETHFNSYDSWTRAAFQHWLQAKYADIATLNASWKKSYTDFGQIRHDPVTWASIMPDCDWEEFRTDNLAAIAREWTGWIKEIDAEHPVLADNVMSNAVWSEFDRGTDDWKLAGAVDRFGISFYPKTGGRLLPANSPWLRSLTFAGASSAGNGSFVISEMQSHYYSEIFTPERVCPTDLIQWNLEALEHGCAGTIYWKWAPFKTGFQLGGRGLVLADGSLSKRADAAGQLGRLFAEHPALARLQPECRAAVLYDRWNNLTVKAINNRVKHIIGDDQPVQARYGLYRMCWERNLPLAIVSSEQLESRLSELSVLFLPYQVALDEQNGVRLADFVRAGGTLVANYPCVDIDRNGRLYEQLPGGPLNALIGAAHRDNLVIDGVEIQELQLSDGAEILAEMDGHPLIIRRKIGNGQIIYAAAAVWNQAAAGQENHAALILDLLTREQPDLVPIKSNVHAALCSGPDADYLILGNYADLPECQIVLPDGYTDANLIFGNGELATHGNTLVLTGISMAVLKLSNQGRTDRI
jgi:beta-galactosidase